MVIRNIRKEGNIGFARNLLYWLKNATLYYRNRITDRILHRDLYQLVGNVTFKTEVKTLSPVSSDSGNQIYSAQIRHEILTLLNIVRKMKPKYVLEIGTEDGGNLFLFSKIASEEALLISIDLPEGRFGGGYPECKIPVYKSFASPNQRIDLIREDSHDIDTLRKVKAILGSNKLDFLFIDGDHTYPGVRKDFEMYSALVREGGMIAFHDIVPGLPELVGEVPKFWQEVKNKYVHEEIVQNWSQGGYGIGLIKRY